MKRGIVGLTYVGALVLVGFFLIPSFLAGQGSSETFTATATVKTAKVLGAEPVKIVIDRYLTDAERTTVMDALKAGGTTAARETLEKMPDIGSLEVLGKTTPIKYAWARSMGPGAGRIVTVVTAVPIHYVMAGMSGDKPKADFQLGLALLILDSNDKGDGEINPAAKIKADAASGSVVIDDYGAVKVWLKDVAKAK
jgi:hypothetical protein